MRLFIAALLLPLVVCQVVYYRYPQQQQRTAYYPVRTNCQSRCNQNRYRWNVRPQPQVPVRQVINIRPVVQTMRPILQTMRPIVQTVPPRIFPNGQTTLPTPLPMLPSPKPINPNAVIPTRWRPAPATTASSASTTTSTTPLPTPPPETTTTTATTTATTTTATTTATTTTATTTPITTTATTTTTTTETTTQSTTPSTTPSTTQSTTSSTTTTQTTSASTTTQTTTVTTTEEITETTELPTPPPESTTTDLPTPPPEEAPQPLHSTVYMRPERKLFTKNPKLAVNPCPVGEALQNRFNVALNCNHLTQPNGGCPEDYWCHTGATFATTACCPAVNIEDKCKMERAIGEGNDLIVRYYYDPSQGSCSRFLYKGTKGNPNNFATKAQCTDACAVKSVVQERGNPCKSGNAAVDHRGVRLECGPANTTCPSGTFCHIGDTPETTACCETSGLTDSCLLSISPGQGPASLKRFYYNTLTKKCTEFAFRGTKGNENNYLTMDECELKCMKWFNPCPTPFNFSFRRECTPFGNECEKGTWCHIGHNAETSVCCPSASPDTCSLPMVLGEGSQNLTRWFADPTDTSCNRKCMSFIYNGAKGNQNNFVTKEACQKACKPECKNPCGSGDMLKLEGLPRQCSPTSPCPNTHWCHVGLSQETTVCCSAVPNTCDLPLALGAGSGKLTRFYFNAKNKKCETFLYKGEGGNQNMFLTQEDCQLVCPTYENPCGTGKPLLIGTEPKVCNPSDRCPSTHFCHIGDTGSPNYCCPKNGDPCDQPLVHGNGTLSLTRFYFDKTTRRCHEFEYLGAKGNANNFLSRSDCQLVCPVLPNPCNDGEPLLDADREPVICGGEDTCAAGYFCHVGGSPETTNCCPGTRKPCDLALENGVGSDKLDRWFFDGSVQMCRQFTYKGMKGNANNFLTKQACRQACKETNPCSTGEPYTDDNGERKHCLPSTGNEQCPVGNYCHVGGNALTTICCPRAPVDPCEQPVQKGHGSVDIPRWYFSQDLNKCTVFLYGGLHGNENNFVSEKACKTTCPEYRNYCPHGLPLVEGSNVETCGIDKGCPHGYICHMSSEHNVSICCEDPMDFCLAPRDSGPCNGSEKRYGYHAESDTCVEYSFGGCGGTLNNFQSLQRCTEICCKEYKRKHKF